MRPKLSDNAFIGFGIWCSKCFREAQTHRLTQALALSHERQSAQISKIKNSGLDQYGVEPFEQQQSGTAGVEGVKRNK